MPLEDRYECVIYNEEPIIFEGLFSFISKKSKTVRQLGEQLLMPSDASIIESSGFMAREQLVKWIRDYERGFTDYEAYIKSQISKKDWKILKKLDVCLDTRILSNMWVDFVNFEQRSLKETPFLISQLSEYKNPQIFDACLGSGATTMGLKLSGLNDITSNEIDEDLIKVAQKQAAQYGISLNLTSYDWKNLDPEVAGSFDSVLCLGNSLTYLFKTEDQKKVLENFRKVLKPDGKLIIDERNYAHHFLSGNYQYSGENVYCGKDMVSAHPINISESMIVMEYEHAEKGLKAHLVLYPFKSNELKELLQETGYKNITTFGDYEPDFQPEKPEFITYVAKK